MREIRLDGITVEPLAPCHCRISSNLRQEDIDELTAFSGLSPEICVAYSVAHSDMGYAVLKDGEPFVLFGAGRRGGIGVPWMVATDDVNRYPVHFYRVSKGVIGEMLERYGYLENYVDFRNELSIRWLKWAGFAVETTETIGYGQFCRFWMGERASIG